MRTIKRPRFICLLLAALLVFCLLVPSSAQALTTQQKLNQLQQQLNEIKSQLAGITDEAKRAKAERDSLSRQQSIILE